MEENKTRIRTFLSQFLRSMTIGENDDVFALGVNSLFAMQLIMWIEKDFGVAVADEDLEMDNFRSISAIAGFIARKTPAAIGA